MKQTLLRVVGLIALPILFCAMLAAPGVNAAETHSVKLTLGKADTINLPANVADILVADPSIADVGALRSNRIYIVGKGLGDTNVLAFDEAGGLISDISVHVRVDEQTLRGALEDFFPDEKNISVRTVNEDIVLTGRVSTPSVANKIRDLTSRFVKDQNQTVVDLMTVKGDQQVMLKMKVLEVNRDILREYGFDMDYGSAGNFSWTGVAGTGLTAPNPFATGAMIVARNGFGPLTVSLQSLERDGLVSTLAEPNLTAISGETAGFLAGGEFPVPTGLDQNGNVTIEFKQFGVSLNFTPRVLSNDRISLLLATEVSSLSQQNGLTLSGVDIPGLSVRRAQTTVELGSGGTIMIAGLIKSEAVNGLNGIPGLKDLPVLGELFKSKSFARRESELLIMVTPYVVSPYAEAEAEVASNDIEHEVALVDTGISPLARKFRDNLEKNGSQGAAENLGSTGSFGYMID